MVFFSNVGKNLEPIIYKLKHCVLLACSFSLAWTIWNHKNYETLLPPKFDSGFIVPSFVAPTSDVQSSSELSSILV